jgi:hypothetical protein
MSSNTFQALSISAGFYTLLLVLLVLYLGGYYFLSQFFIIHINNYIKSHIGNDPLFVKNFYIISLVVKFIIFFVLLKITVRAAFNYIFVEDEKDCDLYNKTNFYAGVISVSFFTIYEFIMFPLYFVDGFDKLLEFIITDIKKYAGMSNSTNKLLEVIKKDIETLLTGDIGDILSEFYTTEYNIITKNPSFVVRGLYDFEAIILWIIPDKYHIKSDKKNVFDNANKLASMVAGNLITYLIILIIMLIVVYKYVGSGFLSILCYIIIAILWCYYIVLTTPQKFMRFSLNALEVVMDKKLDGNRLSSLLQITEYDALKLIKDIASLNPITKMFISKLIDNIMKKKKKGYLNMKVDTTNKKNDSIISQ